MFPRTKNCQRPKNGDVDLPMNLALLKITNLACLRSSSSLYGLGPFGHKVLLGFVWLAIVAATIASIFA